MTVYLSQLERNWIAEKTAANVNLTDPTPQTPLGEMKRVYYVSVLGGDPGKSVNLKELERRWLAKYIVNNGGTPTVKADLATLWKEAVSTAGATPGKYLNENKKLFYLNAS